MYIKYANNADYLKAISNANRNIKESTRKLWLQTQMAAGVNRGIEYLKEFEKRCKIFKTVIHCPPNNMCAAFWYDDYGYLLYEINSCPYEKIPQLGNVLLIKYVDDYRKHCNIISTMLNSTKMNMVQLAAYFGIPYKTMQNWSGGGSTPADYLVDLMIYKLQHEGFWHDKTNG